MLRYWADSKQQNNHTMNKKNTTHADVQSSKVMVTISVQHHNGSYSQDVQTFSFNSTSLTDTDLKPFFSLLISAVVLISLKWR